MSADDDNDFVKKKVFFRIEDYTDALQILRRKIINKFLAKNIYNYRILYILKDSSVRGKYNQQILFIVITAFD